MKILLTGLVGFLLIILGSEPAFAVAYDEYDEGVFYSDYSMTCEVTSDRDTAYGRGCFFATGDKFYVRDEAADSMSVAVLWRIPSAGRSGICRNRFGNGTVALCNKNFPENVTMYYKLGRCDADLHSCAVATNYVNVTAETNEIT